LKGTRDFRVTSFFHESVSLGPLGISLGPLQNVKKIVGDIHNIVFIAGVVTVTGNMLLTSVKNTANK
jgi:hypothetical protein